MKSWIENTPGYQKAYTKEIYFVPLIQMNATFECNTFSESAPISKQKYPSIADQNLKNYCSSEFFAK